MITPLKWLFSIILKSPSPLSQLRTQLVGGKPVGYLQSMVSLSLVSLRTNSFSSPGRGFEPGSSVFKSPELTNEPHCLLSKGLLNWNVCVFTLLNWHEILINSHPNYYHWKTLSKLLSVQWQNICRFYLPYEQWVFVIRKKSRIEIFLPNGFCFIKR